MTGIDLSGNSLSGGIPTELTSFHVLRFLNLSRNDLSGGIPKNIGSSELLESLGFSWNQLSGAIPSTMSNLLSLGSQNRNLSNNHLSGEIPTGYQLQVLDDPSIYNNNFGLCGFPLNISRSNRSRDDYEREEDHKELPDLWLYYFVVAGFGFGFWVWFAGLFLFNSLWIAIFLCIDQSMQKI